MTVTVRPVVGMTNDAMHVARFMRQEDRDEMWQLSRTLGSEAIRRSVVLSSEAYIAYDDAEPIAVFGANIPVLGEYGVPWFLGTRGVDRRAREYLTMGRKFVDHLLTQCQLLENIASADNIKTLRFLSVLGFDIGEPFNVPTGGRAVRFTLKRDQHV